MSRQTNHDVLQPCPDFDAGGLTGREEGVDDGCADGSVVIAGKEIVLAPQGQRPDGILDSVVVDVVSESPSRIITETDKSYSRI